MPTPTKTCKGCSGEFSLSMFNKAGNGGQLRARCKTCTKEVEKSQLEARRLKDGPTPESKCCSRCGQLKPLTEGNFKRKKDSAHGFTAECKTCSKKANAQWMKSDAGKALGKRAAIKSRDKRAIWVREYQKNNREKINSYIRSWRSKNADHCRSVDAAWARKNKGKRTEYRHMRRAAGAFSYAVVPELRRLQQNSCAICRGLLTSLVEIDHIHPIALGGTNERSNLQLLCRFCNRSKGAKHPVDYMQKRGFLL